MQHMYCKWSLSRPILFITIYNDIGKQWLHKNEGVQYTCLWFHGHYTCIATNFNEFCVFDGLLHVAQKLRPIFNHGLLKILNPSLGPKKSFNFYTLLTWSTLSPSIWSVRSFFVYCFVLKKAAVAADGFHDVWGGSFCTFLFWRRKWQ
jgi:hypothetical protein